jgi:Clp amino terminal domain, pathogenicity island component
VYERFTDRARRVMQLANQEAQRFNHDYVGTEHILLGLVKDGSGVAANVLKNLDIDLRKIRLEVEKIVWSGPDMVTMGKLPQTPRAKKVIEYSIEEARNLNHNYVGTEHLLLGLLREEEGVAAQVLMNLGLTLGGVHAEVMHLLGREPDPRRGGLPSAVRPFPWLGFYDFPEEEFPPTLIQALREIVPRIEALHQEQEAAVAQQGFERAAHLRDQADKLIRRRKTIIREWWTGQRVDPSWLTRNDGAVAKLVRAIYEELRWDELPVLADLLEEFGCTDREILDHLRQPREHRRGCWVIDLFLERLVTRRTDTAK